MNPLNAENLRAAIVAAVIALLVCFLSGCAHRAQPAAISHTDDDSSPVDVYCGEGEGTFVNGHCEPRN